MNIISLKGIGEKTAALFDKLNITDTADLIRYYPKDYSYFSPVSSISELKEGEVASVYAECVSGAAIRSARGISVVSCRVSDSSGIMGVTYFNMPYIRGTLKSGTGHVFRGLVGKRGNSLYMAQPKMYKPEEYEKLSGKWQPVYSTVKGLSASAIQKAVKRALEAEMQFDTAAADSPLYDRLPEDIRKKRNLMPYKDALLNIHMPFDMDSLVNARRRLAYEEFFEFILNIERSRDKNLRHNAYPMIETADTVRLITALPYELTEDQKTVWNEISSDLTSGHGLMRLVQGDVGSGKTIIALLALLMCAANGYQGALMAPTEVLASQHYETVMKLKKKFGLAFEPVLLTGSVKGAARKDILDRIESGSANLIIGTHALFQEKVEYKALALAVTDEQHRFGVRQREALGKKGGTPNILIMSATPIPRTLAMILYGDLDVSSIHTMPAGRMPVRNFVVDRSYRKRIYAFIEKEVSSGNRVYVICPQVEAGEIPGVENVVEYAGKLKTVLPESFRIEYLHGQMKPAQKESCMERFAAGEIDVLVSTTVVEVGVNVPEATLMFIENAERFGLAQLHQLRGRVGRSDRQSYCIFMMGESGENARKRLKILETSNDGFEIARQDMKLRGPGDIFGIRQSGDMSFVLGDIYQDSDLIMAAAEDVRTILGKGSAKA